MKNNDFYLDQMGIQAWQIREVVSECHVYALLNDDSQSSCLLVSFPEEEAEQCECLLAEIMQSCGFELARSSFDEVADKNLEYLLMMGEIGRTEKEHIKASCTIILRHSPDTLLQQGQLKREIWEDLQALC